MKLKSLYLSAIAAALLPGLTACSDILDTDNLSTDSATNLLSNATDARKMVNHVYAYFS